MSQAVAAVAIVTAAAAATYDSNGSTQQAADSSYNSIQDGKQHLQQQNS
jgi:hypothetical protein